MTKVMSTQDVVAAILTSGKKPTTIGFSLATQSTSSVTRSEEGVRLLEAFLRIKNPERRQAAINYVADLARVDEAERAH